MPNKRNNEATKSDPAKSDGDAPATSDAPATFEEAITRLGDAVRQLEEGNLSLDESLAQYEVGIRYLSQCQKILTSAERKIEVLSGFDADGNPITENFDDELMTLEEKADGRSRRRTAKPAGQPGKRSKKASTKPRTPSNQRKPDSAAAQDDVDSGGTLF